MQGILCLAEVQIVTSSTFCFTSENSIDPLICQGEKGRLTFLPGTEKQHSLLYAAQAAAMYYNLHNVQTVL